MGTFADGGSDNKATANKALLSVGMDPDNFRTGHTKVMFRAGKLAELEDIREHALTKIMIKMQCHSRRLLVKVVYDLKKAEKKALYSSPAGGTKASGGQAYSTHTNYNAG